jgi:hypothetical protein
MEGADVREVHKQAVPNTKQNIPLDPKPAMLGNM